jgi:hypothetical protein|tara:strand:- start:121 stop:768 length:648 start_codon:yes stop_codon:yes gene_type:complete
MVLSVMEFLIYLQIDDGKLYYKIMKPRDTLNYEFVLSDEIHENLPEGFNQVGMEQINRVLALRCYYTMSELRLKMKQYKTPGAKFIRLEKYYEEVLSRYEDFFEGKIQFPQWRLDEENNIVSFATNLVTGENIRLSPKQGKFVKLFHNHFIKSKIGEEWMWWGEAKAKLNETEIDPSWKCMTDIFEKEEGRKKLNKLFDSNPEGRVIYYRLKKED